MKKETICWDCKNYAKCSWKDGIPVKGWKATPTEIANKYENGTIKTISSFRVEQCPQFEQDKIQVTAKEIAKICGFSERYFWRVDIAYIKGKLKDKGFKLFIIKDDLKNHYYIEKI